MKPELYLHIGGGKTGSSAIQSFLTINRNELRRQGLFYPFPMIFENSEAINHSQIFVRLQNLPHDEKGPYINKVINTLINRTKKNNSKKIIISHEGMMSDNLFIKKLIKKDYFDIRVIIYIRDQESWIESGWKQWGVKHKDCNSIEDWILYVRRHPFWSLQVDWNSAIEKWEKVIPREQISVRIYDREKLWKGDVISDFMHHFGIDDLSSYRMPDKTSSVSANRGFNNVALELVRRSKLLLRNEHDNRLFEILERSMGEKYLKKPFEEYSILSPDSRKEIRDYYHQPNALLAKRYFPEAETLFTYNQITDSLTTEFNTDEYQTLLTELVVSQAFEIKKLERKIEKLLAIKSFPIPRILYLLIPKNKAVDNHFNFLEKSLSMSNIKTIAGKGSNLVIEKDNTSRAVNIVLPIGYEVGDLIFFSIRSNSLRTCKGKLHFFDNDSNSFKKEPVLLEPKGNKLCLIIYSKAKGNKIRLTINPEHEERWIGSFEFSKLN